MLDLASKGFSNPEIARLLGFGVNGVKDHLKQIYQRLGVSTRAEATRAALALGLLDD